MEVPHNLALLGLLFPDDVGEEAYATILAFLREYALDLVRESGKWA
jgi:hypothetical protein